MASTSAAAAVPCAVGSDVVRSASASSRPCAHTASAWATISARVDRGCFDGPFEARYFGARGTARHAEHTQPEHHEQRAGTHEQVTARHPRHRSRAITNVARVLPDYAAYDDAIGLDWYDVDPNLRAAPRPSPARRRRSRVRRGARRRATARSAAATLARRAEVTDQHGPELRALRPMGRRGRPRSCTTRRGPRTRPTSCAPGSSVSPAPRRPSGARRGHRGAALPRVPGRDRDLLRARA